MGLVLRQDQAYWPSSVSFAPPQAMGWSSADCGPKVLAVVPQEPLQASTAWKVSLVLGIIQAHWASPVPQANPSSLLAQQLETRAVVLADLQAQPLLQASQVDLGQIQAYWAALVP